jgi:hypothetical protein
MVDLIGFVLLPRLDATRLVRDIYKQKLTELARMTGLMSQ